MSTKSRYWLSPRYRYDFYVLDTAYTYTNNIVQKTVFIIYNKEGNFGTINKLVLGSATYTLLYTSYYNFIINII